MVVDQREPEKEDGGGELRTDLVDVLPARVTSHREWSHETDNLERTKGQFRVSTRSYRHWCTDLLVVLVLELPPRDQRRIKVGRATRKTESADAQGI